MISLTWQAQPLVMTTLLVIQIVQGLIPVIAAWIIKQTFDFITEMLKESQTTNSIQNLLILLLVYTFIVSLDQMIHPLTDYLNNELARQLKLKTTSLIYQHI